MTPGFRFALWVAAMPAGLAVLIILWGIAVGPARPEWGYLWPFPMDRVMAQGAGVALAVVWSALFAGAAWKTWRLLAPGRARRIGVWLLASPGWVFLAVWCFVPAFGRQALPWLVAVQAGILVPAFRHAGWRALLRQDTQKPSWRRYLWMDLLFIGLPCVAAWSLNGALSWSEARGELLRAIFTYPLYAFLQMLLFLSLPAVLLRRLGVPDRLIVASVAAVFALLHWPNPALAAATGMAMLGWCAQWLQGRRLWILAWVMGLSAAVASTLLPDWLNGQMRIGPGYIDLRIEAACARDAEACGLRH